MNFEVIPGKFSIDKATIFAETMNLSIGEAVGLLIDGDSFGLIGLDLNQQDMLIDAGLALIPDLLLS